MRYIVCCGVLLIGLYGCSKNSEPLSCDSPSVQAALLNGANSSSPGYYSKSLINTKPMQKTDNALSCSASLSVQSNLDNKLILSIPVTYQVYQVNNKSESSTSSLNFTNENQAKLSAWLIQLNDLSKQLGDYQLTPLGAIYVMKESDQQVLYYNGQLVTPEISNTIISIEKTFTVNDKPVFLLGSYTGGTIDQDTRNSLLIEIESQGKYKVTRRFAYKLNGITQSEESLVINGVAPGRPYAESDDFPIYVYTNGDLTIQRDVKPDSYYQTKFANMTTKAIVDQAKADQCYDNANNLLDTSHICLYAMKYCFEYKAIKNPADDDYGKIIKKACN